MLENMYTTKISSNKKLLQNRFAKIRSKNKYFSKTAAVITTIFIVTVMLCATMVMAAFNNDEADVENPRHELIKITNSRKAAVSNDALSAEKHSDINTETNTNLSSVAANSESERLQESVPDSSHEAELKNDIKYVWPCEGEISNSFGERENPFTKKIIKHNGVDIAADEGTEVKSAISGTVTEVGYNSDLGNYVTVESDNVKTIYSNLMSTAQINENDTVHSGQTIARVGNTGKSTGAHLHYEVIVNSEYVDPVITKDLGIK